MYWCVAVHRNERISRLLVYFQFGCLHLLFAFGVCVCGVVFERGRARSTLYPVSFPLFLAPISGYVCMFTGVVVYHLFALGFIGHSPFSRKKEKENGNDFNPLGFFYS